MEELRDYVVALAYGLVGAIWKIFQTHNLEAKQKERLLAMLRHPDYEWRSLSALSANIAADRDTTKRLLLQVNARQRGQPPYYWGLIDRVGQP